MIGFPLVIADSKQDMPGIKPGYLGWQTDTLITEEVLQEVRMFRYIFHSVCKETNKNNHYLVLPLTILSTKSVL